MQIRSGTKPRKNHFNGLHEGHVGRIGVPNWKKGRINLQWRVEKGLREYIRGEFEEAMLHACLAVAATARREYPNQKDRKAFEDFINNNVKVLTANLSQGAMMAGGLRILVPYGTKRAAQNGTISIGECLYEFVRCPLVHEGKFPEKIELNFSSDPGVGWELTTSPMKLTLPPGIIGGMLLAVVGSAANAYEHGLDGYLLGKTPLSTLWGKSQEILKLLGHPSATVGMLKVIGGSLRGSVR